ncbi:MAG TPA: hypothetical protein VEA41_14995 [Salinarimonas sp.]|nr:hypothetical protein [Salinarimonas sp.]
MLVAFATLEDGSERLPDDGRGPETLADLAHEHLAGLHPHRTPLRPAPRAGRPGTVPARPQSCSPVTDRGRAGDTRPAWDLS